MTTSTIFAKSCPTCEGDIQFSSGLDGLELKCLQCTRVITPSQAKAILLEIRRQSTELQAA